MPTTTPPLTRRVTIPIDEDALEVLRRAAIDGSVLKLEGTLDRKLYEKVNKALTLLGGKWDRFRGGHVFPANVDVRGILEEACAAGEAYDAKKTFQFFETPAELARHMVEMAGIRNLAPGRTVLEPSAGYGAIADAIRERLPEGCVLECVEADPDKIPHLKGKDHFVVELDFLQYAMGDYDRIVANPPFSRGQDVAHVLHMWKLLAKNGLVVSVMSAGALFRSDRATLAFRDVLAAHGTYEVLPPATFRDSGTEVNAILVSLHKPGAGA